MKKSNILSKTFRKYALSITGSLFLSSFASLHAQQNILLIIADDLGTGFLDTYSGNSTSLTPTLNTLASNGVTFENAWAYPTCSPTRACLLTGRFGRSTGVGHIGEHISLAEYTLPDALETLGYSTACIGKWHLGGSNNGDDYNPNLMGFDHYEGATGGGIGNYISWNKVTNGVLSSTPITNYATKENVENAKTWIQQQSGPWFCQLAFNAPHSPYHKPPEDILDDLTLKNLPAYGTSTTATDTDYYLAAVHAMDNRIDWLLDELDLFDPNLLANTVIIFIGDNGTPGRIKNNPGNLLGISITDQNGSKGQIYEGGVHVPMIISGAGVDNPDRTNTSPVHVVDLFETVLEFAGADLNTIIPSDFHIDSVSIADYITNETTQNYHQFSYTERFSSTPSNRDGKTVSDGIYKLIFNDLTQTEELYNLTNDSIENVDLLDPNNSGIDPNAPTIQAQLNQHLSSVLTNASSPADTVDFELFESGWGNWNTTGADVRRSSNDAAFANTGSFCVRLRNKTATNSITASIVSNTLDLSSYSEVEIEFSYIVNNFSNSNDEFLLEISTDAGNTFSILEEWNFNDEFTNLVRETGTATIQNPTNDTVLRIRCNASNRRDRVYLDDIMIFGKN